MKIKTQEDLDQLDQKIQRELEVDVKKYANPEVVARFVEMLLFPAYAIFWFSIPMLVFILAFISGYWIPSFTTYDIIGYSSFGLIFTLLTGFSFSLLFVFYQTKKDMLSILLYSLDVMQHILKDTKHLDGRIPSKEQAGARKLLFHGVIHLVTIPTVTQVIAEKIPLIGELFAGMISRILRLMTVKVNFEQSVNLNESFESNSSFTEESILRIDQVKSTVKVVLWSAFGVVGIPLSLLTVFFGCCLMLTLWILL